MKIFKDSSLPWDEYGVTEKIPLPEKFPTVIFDGHHIDVWIDKDTSLVEVEHEYLGEIPDDFYPASEEEENLYWRYRKAWELMNR